MKARIFTRIERQTGRRKKVLAAGEKGTGKVLYECYYISGSESIAEDYCKNKAQKIGVKELFVASGCAEGSFGEYQIPDYKYVLSSDGFVLEL